MFARFVLGTAVAATAILPAAAGQMNAEEARRFVSGKVFAFTCVDGTRGAGRLLDDMGAAGMVQFAGAGPTHHVRLPGNTLQVRGQSVCASLRGLPFEPCFNLDKRDERSFRGSVSGMSFAYCDFHHQGAVQMLMARAVAHPRSSRASEQTGSVEVSARVETLPVEAAGLDPVKPEPKPAPVKSNPVLELRRSTE
ncbi:MAG TPA: hypothetical protein VKT76_08670 [Bradyrhizobium sp.]|nr:hypothetical protein [Bradyrhizobium sp.]